jgi:hypothetical protein
MQHRVLRAAAVTAAYVLLAGSPAHATVADALVVHGLDIAASEAATALYNADDPNITCSNPVVKGMVLTPDMDTRSVLVRGTDVGVAEGHCASLTRASYSVDLLVVIERWDDAAQQYVPVCRPDTGPASSDGSVGAAATIAKTVCVNDYSTLPPGSPVPIHRAHAILTNSVNDDKRHGYSPIAWPAGPEAVLA